MLHQRLRADLKVYRVAVDLLESVALKGVSRNEFDKLAMRATRAQDAFERARERFNKHVSEHGC